MPKVLHPLCGRPMLAYVLDAWAAPRRRRRRPAGRRLLAAASRRSATPFGDGATFALQDEPRGTGDARRGRARRRCPTTSTRSSSCRATCRSSTGADLDALLEARRQDDAAIALASVYAADPAELGRVVRGEFGTVERIVEAKDATDEELAGNEINAGLYAFDAAWLRRRIGDARARRRRPASCT